MKLRPTEIAKYISTSKAYISKLIKNNMLIKDKNGFIDTENEINDIYFKRKFSGKRLVGIYKGRHHKAKIYPDGYLSPTKLAEKLNISRAAISKAVKVGNLIRHNTGFIDLNNDTNIEYINRGKGERRKTESCKKNEVLFKNEQRECSNCKQILSLSDFYYDNKKNMYNGKCIKCTAITAKIWAEANKDEIKYKRNIYKEKYKAIIKEKAKNKYHENIDYYRKLKRERHKIKMQDNEYRMKKRQYHQKWKSKIIDECKNKENIFAENNKELIMILEDMHKKVRIARKKVRKNIAGKIDRKNNPEKYRERHRKYRENNIEKLKERWMLNAKRQIETISDTYIISILNHNSIIRIKKEDVPPGFFELYRANLMLKREIKNTQGARDGRNERTETVNYRA